jgi:hypothetical protein
MISGVAASTWDKAAVLPDVKASINGPNDESGKPNGRAAAAIREAKFLDSPALNMA